MAGNVQEEIMFAVAPECLVGMLFSEKMKSIRVASKKSKIYFLCQKINLYFLSHPTVLIFHST